MGRGLAARDWGVPFLFWGENEEKISTQRTQRGHGGHREDRREQDYAEYAEDAECAEERKTRTLKTAGCGTRPTLRGVVCVLCARPSEYKGKH